MILVGALMLVAQAQSLPACVGVATQSRYVPFGYNHIVILKSGCTAPQVCKVSTDVNPEVQTVDLPPGQTVEVMTYMGAAASTFQAKVTCKAR